MTRRSSSPKPRTDGSPQDSFSGQAYDAEIIEKAWALADEEFPHEAVGFAGSEGGQFTVIHAPTAPGTYRICGGLKDALCSAAFEVTS
jgi:hypothetical protein